MRNLLFLRTVVALAVFYVGVIIGCGGGNSGSGYTPPPPTTYTATLTAGTGITSVIPYQLSGAAGATSSTTLVVAPGYQNPTASGNCAVTISGTTITVTFGSSNCSSTISATQIPVVNATLSTMVTPGAVFDSDFSTASITIKVVATGSGFSFKAAPTQALSTGYSAIPLEDTGTTANGGEVYSVTFTPGVQFPGLRYYGKSADFLGFIILAVDNSGNTMNNMGSYVELGIVSKSLQTNSTQVANGVFVTPNAVNIVQGYTNPLSVMAVTNQIYSLYPDVFDNIVVSNSRVDSLLSPAHFNTQNSTLGIGSGSGGDASVSTALDYAYGSSGRLTGITQESSEDALQRAFLHEFGHNFAFFLNNSTLDLTRGNGAHQSALCTSVGWLGTNQYLVQQPNGDFLITSKGDGTYNDWELYLLGLESSNSVPGNQYCLFNYSGSYQVGTIVPLSAATPVKMSDIIGIYGQRSPSFTTSQKSFRVLFVWLLENQPTAAELAFHDDIAAFYASGAAGEINTSVFPPLPYAFNAATKGNGTLVVAVPVR